MRHLVDHRKLGRTASHRKALLRNLATSLVMSERIETTLPKALELRRVADRLITLAKSGTLHSRRQAARVLQSDEAVRKLFSGLGERFAGREGGYTRIYKFGYRRGDSAEMAAIEYLGYELPRPETKGKAEAKKAPAEKKKATKRESRPKTEKAEARAEEKGGGKKRDEVKAAPKAVKKTAKKVASKEAAKGKKSKEGWGLFGRKKKDEST